MTQHTQSAPTEQILLKMGEIVLKGLNRRSFEDKLMQNVRRHVQPFGSFQVFARQSTIYVLPQKDDCDLAGAFDSCRKVFGIARITRAMPCNKTVDDIVEAACTYLDADMKAARSFKVESKRADKRFPLNSIQLSQAVGGRLADRYPHITVDVHTPDLTVYVEIRETAAYVHSPAKLGAGGLPVGMGGTAVSLLSGGIDSPVASYMMARRGVQIEMVHFIAPPYTGQQAQDKVVKLAQLLTPYCGRMIVHLISVTEIQEAIRANCPEEYFTLLQRRFMMRLAERVAKKAGAEALVTGESLGQVASQTMKALNVTGDVVTLPILQPLIGMDKVEITRLSRQIGTFETSILPFEDCCTVFTPRHPATRPDINKVRKAESVLDIEGLVERALAAQEWVRVRPGTLTD